MVLDGTHICKPATPLPDDREFGRHPLARVVLVQGKIETYYCGVCKQKFDIQR